ncbi:hypothetical protein M3180_12800 [Paenibacillus camelliae]|nr:hypothetical protein [Paenibacillus camelliae]
MNKKIIMATTVIISLIVLILAVGLYIWRVQIHSQAKPKPLQIPFSYNLAGDLNPEALTTDIMQAIGYPDAIPFVTSGDRFNVILYSRPQMQDDVEFHIMTSSFRILVQTNDNTQMLSYEFQLSQQRDHLVLIDRQETINVKSLIDRPIPVGAFTLSELFSAIRDFPADSYREHSQYGDEDTDLYSIRFNDSLIAESFFYSKHGYVKTVDTAITIERSNEIPFLISHLNWGDIRDESLHYDDPRRYYNASGIGRVNLLYIPEHRN